jgi:hypothetical protein
LGNQINNVLVRTLGAVPLMLMPFSGAMADWTPMNGGMMGNRNLVRHRWRISVRPGHHRSGCRSVCGPAQEEIDNRSKAKGIAIMKIPLLYVAITACALSSVPLASAQDTAAPAKPAMNMEMDAQMSQMQANVTEMQSQMEKIHATTDPKERQELMQAHMQTMQESMTMMRNMSKPMEMHGGQGGGMAMGADKGMPGEKGMMTGDMMQHHQMMERRMGMMQMMMDQMLQHQQMMESMPAR